MSAPIDNPFASIRLEQDLKQTTRDVKQMQRRYLDLPIAEKTAMQQQQTTKITVSDLRREDKEIFGTDKPTSLRSITPIVPENFLPETMRPTIRTGVKQFIDKTKQLCRLSINTAMKESEMEALNAFAIDRNLVLQKQELDLNRLEIAIERKIREMEEVSLGNQRSGEQSGLKLDQVKRKIDELQVVLDQILQEISRQCETLQVNLKARDMIEIVAKLAGTDISYLFKNRENQLEFFQLNHVDIDYQPKPKSQLSSKPLQVLTREKTQEIRQFDQFSVLRLPEVMQLARSYIQFGGVLSLSEVKNQIQKDNKQTQKISIDFDFITFVSQIQTDLSVNVRPLPPGIIQDKIIEKPQILRNFESQDLEAQPYNIFERLGQNSLQIADSRIQRANNLLIQSYDYPPVIPFEQTSDFNDNLSLLEESNLVRTNNLQDINQMIEGQQSKLSEANELYGSQEIMLQQKVEDVSQKIQISQKLVNSFDRDALKTTAEAFIYDLTQYQSLDELTVDKISDELDMLHACIAQSGVFAEVIQKDDKNLNSNTILARMELIMNETMANIYSFTVNQIKEGRYVLDKRRREVARNAKMNELMKLGEKQAEKQKIREQRLKKVKPITRTVVEKSFFNQKKKTAVQLDLEERLKREQGKDVGEDTDYYQ
ncbi:hypothetical protein SS50377_24703 [Spironucleus salmonicida]|uniref:Uncharacterized protein n=1 Tax=Spironucleus salmonicida TaxID=348837 RepID=V6LUV1_9EUKA|nr:hypothetical protein SS50377_24703 [Spironucleus salmonicida]|eukprot:EST44584.1 hypothetical protein SS50377_15588 [Spironucleus salmonicida]